MAIASAVVVCLAIMFAIVVAMVPVLWLLVIVVTFALSCGEDGTAQRTLGALPASTQG